MLFAIGELRFLNVGFNTQTDSSLCNSDLIPVCDTANFSLSRNDQIALLIQERDGAKANEDALAEKVSELMDEIMNLNEEIAKLKQQKLGTIL